MTACWLSGFDSTEIKAAYYYYYSITYLHCEHQTYLCRYLARLPRLFWCDLFQQRLRHYAHAISWRGSLPPASTESHVSKCVRRQITRTKKLFLAVSTSVTALTKMNLHIISSQTITSGPLDCKTWLAEQLYEQVA